MQNRSFASRGRNASYGRNKSRWSRGPSSGRPFGGSGFGRSRARRGRSFSERIDISKFIKKANPNIQSEQVKITNSFLDFNFSNAIKENLKKRNYLTPTPIQDQSINHILAGRDIIGLANTGTGKTAAFLLPFIEKIYKDRTQKVLIIAPTRELAIQIDSEFREFSQGMKIYSTLCVGGSNMYQQIKNLRRNPHFVIGTPGRLKDMGKRRVIDFGTFASVVIDEFDRMLDMGFIDDITEMLNQLPSVRQSLFFSATMPPKISYIISKFANNPVTVQVKTSEIAENVERDVIRVQNASTKFAQLCKLLSNTGVNKSLIFVETKREVEKITIDLTKNGFKANSIHGDKRQYQRQDALYQFKTNRVNVLVATDVAARGLDIKDITHVINYTVPQNYDAYIHRVGRTGREGKKGFAYTFVE